MAHRKRAPEVLHEEQADELATVDAQLALLRAGISEIVEPLHPPVLPRATRSRVRRLVAIAMAAASFAGVVGCGLVLVASRSPRNPNLLVQQGSSSAVGAARETTSSQRHVSSSTVPKTVPSSLVVDVGVCANNARPTEVAFLENQKPLATIKVWDTPNDAMLPKWTLTTGRDSSGTPLFLVLEDRGEFLRVQLPVEPNRPATGWVRASEVGRYKNRYRLRFDVTKRQLTACDGVKAIRTDEVLATSNRQKIPLGTFFIMDLTRQHGAASTVRLDDEYSFGLSARATSGGVGGRLRLRNEVKALAGRSAGGADDIVVSSEAMQFLIRKLWLGTPIDIVA